MDNFPILLLIFTLILMLGIGVTGIIEWKINSEISLKAIENHCSQICDNNVILWKCPKSLEVQK